MRDIATATLSGNLARDVELRQLPSGADVARLRVATTTRRRAGGWWVDKTNYFTVEAYGAQARACAQYLRKGSRVFVDAELDWREWTDQQDNKREAVTFKARQILFEGGRASPEATDDPVQDIAAQVSGAPAARQPAAVPTAAATGTGNGAAATADDLPFAVRRDAGRRCGRGIRSCDRGDRRHGPARPARWPSPPPGRAA